MIKGLSKISKGKFVRNVVLVATGTAGAQAITMGFAPVITRMYGPEAFGLLGTFLAILAIVTPIAALSYPIAIVLPRSDDDAKGIAKLSFRIALFIALVLSVVLLFTGEQFASLLGVESIAGFLLLVPLAMFFSALQQIMQQWLIRKKQFKVTARIAVSQSLVLNTTKVGAGWFNPVAAVLIVVVTLGNALYAAQLWFGAKKWTHQDGRIDRAPSIPVSLKEVAYQHRDFPFYRAPQVFLDALSQGLPVLMLASFSGPAAAGFYTLGRTVLGMPSALIGKAIADVFYPHINEAALKGQNLTKLILKATLVLAGVGVFPFGLVIAFGPWLFSFVFGADWTIAGEYARWLSVWLFFAFCNRPSVAAIPVLRMQGVHLLLNVLGIVLRIGALLIGFMVLESALIAVMLFSVTYAFMNVALIGITLAKSKVCLK